MQQPADPATGAEAVPRLLESIGYHGDTDEIVVATTSIPPTTVLGPGTSRLGYGDRDRTLCSPTTPRPVPEPS